MAMVHKPAAPSHAPRTRVGDGHGAGDCSLSPCTGETGWPRCKSLQLCTSLKPCPMYGEDGMGMVHEAAALSHTPHTGGGGERDGHGAGACSLAPCTGRMGWAWYMSLQPRPTHHTWGGGGGEWDDHGTGACSLAPCTGPWGGKVPPPPRCPPALGRDSGLHKSRCTTPWSQTCQSKDQRGT